MTIDSARGLRIIEFPDPARPGDDGNAFFGVLVDGEPALWKPAVGRFELPIRLRIALDIESHSPGLLSFLQGPGHDVDVEVVDRVDIREGTLLPQDLEALGAWQIKDLRLGWEKGTDRYMAAPVQFAEGADLSALHDLLRFELHGVDLEDDVLETLDSAHSVLVLTLVGTKASVEALSPFNDVRILLIEDDESFGTDLSFLNKMPSLELLQLRFSGITGRQTSDLFRHDQLVMVDLSYSRRFDGHLGFAAHMPKLEFLEVSGTAVDDASFRGLTALPSLTDLHAQCTGLTDTGIQTLGDLPVVSTVNVAGDRISDAGLAAIVRAMPTITSLDIRSTDVTTDGLRQLAGLRNLQNLSVDGELLTVEVAEVLAENTQLAQVAVAPPHAEPRRYFQITDVVGSVYSVGSPA